MLHAFIIMVYCFQVYIVKNPSILQAMNGVLSIAECQSHGAFIQKCACSWMFIVTIMKNKRNNAAKGGCNWFSSHLECKYLPMKCGYVCLSSWSFGYNVFGYNVFS